MIQLPTVFPVTSHTRHVGTGTTFVAIRGVQQDGVNYITEALSKGATRIVISQDVCLSDNIIDLIKSHNAQILKVDNPRRALAYLSAQALDFPAKKLTIVGITGTKGKTTTTFIAEHIFKQAGYKTALLSTVKNKIDNISLETDLTTQHPDYLQVFFDTCVKNNIDIVIMEVAAQGLSLHRTDGIEFSGFIFTNFSQEHGEFYSTQEEYFDAKKALACQLKPHYPLIINNDDEIVARLGQDRCDIVDFGIEKPGVITASIEKSDLSGISGTLLFEEVKHDFRAPALAGYFNVYNIMAAAALAYSFEIDPSTIISSLATFKNVPGRLEKYELPNRSYAFIDYAHTPSSYQALLSTLKPLTNQLIVIFGCGGDRDRSKRSVMGSLACKYADIVILTTDNPRSENPEDIIKDIQAGIKEPDNLKVIVELDREKAIVKAYALSKPGSIIALLGKGPDEYQLVKGVKYYFSEREILESILE